MCTNFVPSIFILNQPIKINRPDFVYTFQKLSLPGKNRLNLTKKIVPATENKFYNEYCVPMGAAKASDSRAEIPIKLI